VKQSIKCILVACVILTGVFPAAQGLHLISDNEKIQRLLTSTNTDVYIWMMFGSINDLQKNNDSTSFYPVNVFVFLYQKTSGMTGWAAVHLKSTTQRFYTPSNFDFKGILTRHFICGIFRHSYVPPPEIVFTMDITQKTLTVVSADNDILWSDISTTESTCTIPTTGYVRAGDRITNCYNTITILYLPTDTVIGTYQFPPLPQITFVMNEQNRTLTVVSAPSEDIPWSDIINIGNGTCTIPTEGYVIAGDVITDCYNQISLLYMPSETLLGTYQFPS
jgi:hypothetical protein